MSASTGIVGVGGVTGTGPVTFCVGVAILIPEFGGRNGTGYFNSGRCCPAGMGRTNCGVTITINSVFCLVRDID